MFVTLTPEQMAQAIQTGRARRADTLRRRREYGSCRSHVSDADMDDQGAMGELAVSLALGVAWNNALETWGQPDAGPFQVRLASRASYSLIIRPKDKDSEIFILVLGHAAPTFRLVGWILGRDAKQDRWRKNPGGDASAWFVPQSALQPMEMLQERLLCPAGEPFMHHKDGIWFEKLEYRDMLDMF
jgi:hypothetical protein